MDHINFLLSGKWKTGDVVVSDLPVNIDTCIKSVHAISTAYTKVMVRCMHLNNVEFHQASWELQSVTSIPYRLDVRLSPLCSSQPVSHLSALFHPYQVWAFLIVLIQLIC
jgi:hypothetical protein